MDSKISNDLLDKAVKEQIRANLVEGYMAATAPRAKAQELADLVIHAVDEAVSAMDRVTRTAANTNEEFSTFFAAMQVMHGVLFGMIEQAKEVAIASPDFNHVDQIIIGGRSH